MKNFFSRVAAIAATTAMLASYATIPAFAAGVVTTITSADAQTFTINLPAGVNLAAGDDITVKITNTSTGAAIANNVVTALTLGGVDELAQAAGVTSGYIQVTTLVAEPDADDDLLFTLTSALDLNTAYTISYSDSAGNYSAAMINFGTANVVTVTATVEPTLTLALANVTPDLGILSPTAVISSAPDPTVTVSTNANGGFTTFVSANDGNGGAGLYSATATYSIPAHVDADVTATNEEFGIVVTETANADDAVEVANPLLVNATPVAIATGGGVTAGYQNTINVQAAISAITPAASDYTTSLTFTATANF